MLQQVKGGYHPTEVLENSRKTKSLDIFSLGCILFYLLINGQHHPFGDNKILRTSNIIFDKPDLSPLAESNLTACDLISQMISKDQSKRPPSIQQILIHPLFWSNDNKIKFIDASFNALFKDPINSSNLKKLVNYSTCTSNGNTDCKLFLTKPWDQLIDQILLTIDEPESPLIKKANYQFNQVFDLARLLEIQFNIIKINHK